MTALRDELVAAMVAGDSVEDSLDLVLATLISRIEAQKSRVRHDYEGMKEAYLRGDHRSLGLLKRECEDRLQKRNGEILGMEAAVGFLYNARTEA